MRQDRNQEIGEKTGAKKNKVENAMETNLSLTMVLSLKRSPSGFGACALDNSSLIKWTG